MAQSRYQIFQLSARAVMSYAVEVDGTYSFDLSASATEKCRSRTVTHEQDSNALFFQTMCVLYGDGYAGPNDGTLIPDLSDAIFYMDFDRVFDRSAANKKQRLRQEKAQAMFRLVGAGLDFGSSPHRYVAFERSGSMSRQARLSFIQADLYDAVRRRIMLGMDIDYCQLTKLYAYNGLMLSSGTRIDGVDIDRPHRVIVVENRTHTEHLVSVITVEADGSQDTTRKYYRVEKKTDVPITCLDGEGLISPRFAAQIDRVLCGEHVHTSFQIRLPYVKGMLHQVDFHSFLTDCATRTITDLWGVEHRVKDADVILTRSMCKGLGWMAECGMGWLDYWDAFRRNYDIARFEKYKSLENRKNIPLLMIPAAEPRIRSARDWEARFEAVRDTFFSQVGQICNAALDRSIIACNDNSDDEERQCCREETELLDIDQENTAQDRKRLVRDGDSPAFTAMMEAYQKKAASQSYRDAVSAKCRELLDGIVKPVTAVRDVVALGKQGLLWELLPDAVLPSLV